MSTPSNLYAEKIYSEHPLVLWALDDTLDYKSLITEAQRNLATAWTPTNCALAASSEDLTEPFVNSHLSRIRVNVPVTETLEASVVSPNILNINTLADLGTFTIGSYFYSNSVYLQTVSIGYEYTDPSTSTIVQNLKTFTSTLYQKWGFISETFEIPNVSAQLRIVVKIKIFEGSGTSAENEFYINLGNPHYVFFLDNIERDFFNSNQITSKLNLEGVRKQIEFKDTNGINVSFAVICENGDLLVRTFERGVGETLSCGSGSLACFLSHSILHSTNDGVRVFNRGSKKVLAFEENFHCIFFDSNKNLILRGKGTKIADIEI